jgi:hypothetical protein
MKSFVEWHTMEAPIMIGRLARSFPIFVLVIVTLATPLYALESGGRNFLPAGSVDIAALVPPPPAVGSAAFKEEMAVVLWLQRTRTPAQVEFARKKLDCRALRPATGRRTHGGNRPERCLASSCSDF